jgi:soluble lytic murein transglycosylase-like protein
VKPFFRWVWPVVLFAPLFLFPVTPPDGTAVSFSIAPLSLSDQRDTIVAQEARSAGVPVDLALAVSHVENWTGDSMAVSSRGAVGLMQVLPKYWQHEFEEECGCGSLFQRRLNACKGVRVLKLYLKQQKTTALALRAYHGSLNLHSAGDDYIAQVLDRLVR